MTASPEAQGRSLSIRPRFGRRTLILATMALAGTGMALNWSWLVAVGAAPLILSLAPCLVMCGAGLCMMCKSKSCESRTGSTETPGSTTN